MVDVLRQCLHFEDLSCLIPTRLSYKSIRDVPIDGGDKVPGEGFPEIEEEAPLSQASLFEPHVSTRSH